MHSKEIERRLAEHVEEDLALFERLLAVCDAERLLLEKPALEGLGPILEEKESLMKQIEDRESESARLWSRLGEEKGGGDLLDRLNEGMNRARDLVHRIQSAEAAISDCLARRQEDVRLALGTLRRSGRALSAYRPAQRYSPRFVDKRQ